MDGASPLPDEAIPRHGEENAALAQKHDEHDGAEAENGSNFDQETAPCDAGSIDADGDGISDVEGLVVDQSGKYDGDEDIEDGADDKRTENADGHVAPRILGFLGCSGYGVETDVGEEDGGGARTDTAPAESAGTICRRYEWMPVQFS